MCLHDFNKKDTEVVLRPEAISELQSPDCRCPAALCLRLQPSPGDKHFSADFRLQSAMY